MDKRISENISFKLFLNAMFRNHKGASSFLITNKVCFNACKEIKNKLRSCVGFFQNVYSGTQHS